MPDFTFTAGNRPTAAQWNAWVRDQVTTNCTSTTRPASPVNGRRIYEEDTERRLRWKASLGQWVDDEPIHFATIITANAAPAYNSVAVTAGQTTTGPVGSQVVSNTTGRVLRLQITSRFAGYAASSGGGKRFRVDRFVDNGSGTLAADGSDAFGNSGAASSGYDINWQASPGLPQTITLAPGASATLRWRMDVQSESATTAFCVFTFQLVIEEMP
jgi:hypothetical protein